MNERMYVERRRKVSLSSSSSPPFPQTPVVQHLPLTSLLPPTPLPFQSIPSPLPLSSSSLPFQLHPPLSPVTPSHPNPRIPSNLAATKVNPGSLVASAKVCPLIINSPIPTTSVDKNPVRLPVPYRMAKDVPFFA